MKQATTGALSKMSGNDLLYVVEKWLGCCKKCIACEGLYFKKETLSKSQESVGIVLLLLKLPV
jgi:hypothetical protein